MRTNISSGEARIKKTICRTFIYLFALVVAAVAFYPFFVMIISSTHDNYNIVAKINVLPGSYFKENFMRLTQNIDLTKGIMNSLIVSIAVTIAVVFIAGFAAYGLVRFRFKLREVCYNLIMAGMMFPVFSTIIPVFRMEAAWGIASSGNRWLSLVAVILPQIAGNLCFAIIVLMGFIESVPIELEESAYMDGCNVFQVYFHIIMPAAKSSFATVAIFSFLWSYNDLFTQNFFLRVPKEKTITLLLNEISSQAGVDYGLMAASVVLIVAPVLLVYVALQKHIIKGLTAGAIKG